ncbi:hypothetical protein [Microbacterium sp. K24]|uniref:hypothetical protein n=1 Tax=Microbacterium sp. K24 TaxID=2305446 RepID=UPI00197C373F|nr:hypothetical protein [Microbacterium sp. K24]
METRTRARYPEGVRTTPCILGAGERIFDGVPTQQLERTSVRATSLVTHVTYRRV